MLHELPAAAVPVVNAQVLVGDPNPVPPGLPTSVSTQPLGRRYPPRQHQSPTLYSNSSFSALNSKLTWEEAIEKPNVVKAMDVELVDLQDGKKVQCMLTPEGKYPFGSTWAYKLKDMDIDLWKARICPQGFSQVPGVDYDPDKVAAPTVSLLVMYLFHHVVLHRLMHVAAFDFKGAFSNVLLEEEIYIRPPRGVVAPPRHSLRLLNSLQGLKQSAYNWYKMLDIFLRSQDFAPNTVEPAQYYRLRAE